MTESGVLTQDIVKESREFHDIIQVNIPETSVSLVPKLRPALAFLTAEVSLHWVVKTFNLPRFLRLLARFPAGGHLVLERPLANVSLPG